MSELNDVIKLLEESNFREFDPYRNGNAEYDAVSLNEIIKLSGGLPSAVNMTDPGKHDGSPVLNIALYMALILTRRVEALESQLNGNAASALAQQALKPPLQPPLQPPQQADGLTKGDKHLLIRAVTETNGDLTHWPTLKGKIDLIAQTYPVLTKALYALRMAEQAVSQEVSKLRGTIDD